MIKALRDFIRWESAAGVILVIVAVLAMVISNTSWNIYYINFLSTELGLHLGPFGFSKSLLHWINDGLMAVFFLLVGLEIKREILVGELNSLSKAMLPAIAAIGGMIVPALIYVFINQPDETALRGWAIPTATDIAFALGLLSLLGSRVPLGLKVFLTAIAILDDLGAIIIIAIFYTDHLSYLALALALICLALLFLLNRLGFVKFLPYAVVGIFLWICVLQSGVHATLAGVVLALFYPITDKSDPKYSPLQELEHALHPWITFGVLPLFAFANAGVPLTGVTFNTLLEPIPLGIALGLLLGKQSGVFLATVLAIKLKLAPLPRGATWGSLYGVAILCGIGFTMSLFVGTLAFEKQGLHYSALVRLGVLTGSIASGIIGYIVLSLVSKKIRKSLAS